ncbi:MAG: rod shape-determining protein RodA [Bacteroidetes bacterium]|nr:rod shape-determining protein RodA [Bacteroidota bacterium]MBK8414612.1 rod shape-determining protein RodA [Bacteroidota bacterium]
MRKQKSIFENIDWLIVGIYLVLVLIGWVNIYAAVYNEEHKSILDISQNYGRQMVWIATSLVLAIFILVIDGKFFEAFAYPIYGFVLLILVAVLLFGREVAGSKSWFEIGAFRLQPAEFAKFATNMALAKYLSTVNINMKDFRTKLVAGTFIIIPIAMILLQNDTGSALVFCSFIFVLYREGLSQNVLIIGFFAVLLFVLALMVSKIIIVSVLAGIAVLAIALLRKTRKNIITISVILALAAGVVFSVDYFFHNVLEPHQKQRINVLLGKDTDLKGAGYNVNQSLIAIGSGGLTGKGFLNGTQTKFDFVPEQSTDFIFCTVGEEWGFLGSLVILGLFTALLYRILFIAERQKSDFTRIYAYGVASILFIHLMVNIGMTIGLLPVIGIPLPFLSYGGSSLWSFTILLFILVKLDSYRTFILR